jgi:hypothetical protein
VSQLKDVAADWYFSTFGAIAEKEAGRAKKKAEGAGSIDWR